MRLKTLLIVMAILLTEFCERITYYGIVGNMILFLQSFLDIPTETCISINLAFSGITMFIPIFGGWIADAKLGRFNTIYGSFLFYLVGSILLPATAFDYEKYLGVGFGLNLVQKRIFYFIGLGLIAIGTGGIKSNVSPFGAHQLLEEGQEAIQSFFNWFYWFVNLGSAIALSVIVYIQQDISFFIGYVIPAVCIILSVVIFLLPKNYYKYETIGGSAFTDLFSVAIQGIRRKLSSTVKLGSFLDYARSRNGGSFSDGSVNDLIIVLRMVPVFLCLIMFWTIYTQSQSTFVVQAECMNVKLGGLSLPVASLGLFDTIIILTATPIIDRVVLPLIAKLRGGRPISTVSRMGFGMFLASIAIVIAGIVEITRKNDIAAHGVIIQTLPGADKSFNASSISVLLQIPQFMLIGLGEIFTSITALEFAFAEAPERLKCVLMGINLCTIGLGSFLGSALVSIVNAATKPNNWMPDEINHGHFEYFCFLLSGMMIVNIIIFIPIARWYLRKKDQEQQVTDGDGDGHEHGDEEIQHLVDRFDHINDPDEID